MRTWRDIPQQVKSRAMSDEGRRRMRRRNLRIVLVAVAAGLFAASVLVFGHLFRSEPQRLARAVQAEPVKAIELNTNGVLDRAWIVRTLNLPPAASLMGLDLDQLRNRLLQDGQVRTASLTRRFPGTLMVNLEERTPVARVNARFGSEAPQVLLVARDGTVYAGTGYAPATLAALPWLAGVQLQQTGGRMQPIAGMDLVSDLLAKARNETPQLYRQWRVVSLARLASDQLIEVQADNVQHIIFSARPQDDFFRQLAKLDMLVDSLNSHGFTQVQQINLSVDASQVPVVPGQVASPGAPPRP